MTDEPAAATRPAVPLGWRIWNRFTASVAATGSVIAAVYQHFARPVTFREVIMFAGAALLGAGLYPIYAPAALIVPGLVLTYVAIAGVK